MRTVRCWPAFAQIGRPPRRVDVERLARHAGADPGVVLAELAGHDVIAVDERGEIRARLPLLPNSHCH